MTTPLAILNFKATSRPVATIEYFADPKKVTATYDGLDCGVAEGTPQELADLLLAYHHDPKAGGRLCRTAVISVQTPPRASKAQLDALDRRLLKAAADLQKFLKIASMLGWVHGNTGTRHIHLIFANSNGRRTLDLRPKFLKEIQGFLWTAQFLTGRGKGKRKALPMYPKARQLDARVLAVMLLDSRGNVRRDRWDRLVAAGKISDFRVRQNGSIISFRFQHRRIRLSTLKAFLAELTSMKNQNTVMTTLVDPDKPLPKEAEKSLHESGFTSEDVQEVLRDIRTAFSLCEHRSPTTSVPAHTKPQQSPQTIDL